MPTPAVTLKLKQYRRRFGIAAPRVTVRTHIPWPWMVAAGLLLMGLVASLSWMFAQRGEVASLANERQRLEERVVELQKSLDELRHAAETGQQAVQLEKTSQKRLMARVGALESENSALKEEIAFFERLVPAAAGDAAVRVERLWVSPEGEAGRYRYRLLARFSPGKGVNRFVGRLELRLAVRTPEGDRELVWPNESAPAAEGAVEVRSFLRKEGSFNVPAGSRLKRVEARLLDGGVVKASKNIIVKSE